MTPHRIVDDRYSSEDLCRDAELAMTRDELVAKATGLDYPGTERVDLDPDVLERASRKRSSIGRAENEPSDAVAHLKFTVLHESSPDAVLHVLAPVEGWRRNASARWPHRTGATVHAHQPECDSVLPRCLPVYAPVCPSCGRPSHDGVVEPTGRLWGSGDGPDEEQVCDGTRLFDRPVGVYDPDGTPVPPDDTPEPF